MKNYKGMTYLFRHIKCLSNSDFCFKSKNVLETPENVIVFNFH